MAPAAEGEGLTRCGAFAARVFQFEDDFVQRVEALLPGAAEQGILRSVTWASISA